MALEFKGIKANSLRLMANHDKLNTIMASAVESSDKLISHVGDFKGMSDRMVEDIEFAANVLGNGSGNGSEDSGKAKETPKTETAVIQPDPLKATPPVITAPVGFDLRSGAVNRHEMEAPAVHPLTHGS